MSMSGDVDGTSIRTWRWYAVRVVFGVVVAFAVLAAGTAYWIASRCLQAEERLQATLFTIRLVEQFVFERNHWPSSWGELEQVSFPSVSPSPLNGGLTALRIGGAHGYNWPQQAARVKDLVIIDFEVDPRAITAQNAELFDAIRPNGMCYPYRHYGFIESLQETIDQALTDHPEH